MSQTALVELDEVTPDWAGGGTSGQCYARWNLGWRKERWIFPRSWMLPVQTITLVGHKKLRLYSRLYLFKISSRIYGTQCERSKPSRGDGAQPPVEIASLPAAPRNDSFCRGSSFL